MVRSESEILTRRGSKICCSIASKSEATWAHWKNLIDHKFNLLKFKFELLNLNNSGVFMIRRGSTPAAYKQESWARAHQPIAARMTGAVNAFHSYV